MGSGLLAEFLRDVILEKVGFKDDFKGGSPRTACECNIW